MRCCAGDKGLLLRAHAGCSRAVLCGCVTGCSEGPQFKVHPAARQTLQTVNCRLRARVVCSPSAPCEHNPAARRTCALRKCQWDQRHVYAV